MPACRVRTSLLAGVSLLALIVAGPSPASAGDLPPRPAIITKAPPAIKSDWTWWVEGGAAHLGGDPGVAGLNNPPFDVASKNWGWEGAAGFDYRLDGYWHLSGQFRYGRNKAASNSNNPLAVFNVINSTAPIVAPFPNQGSNTAEHKESHWLADFMVGRELGLGQGLPSMARFGVRVAEIRGKTTGSAQWNNVPTVGFFATVCATAPTPNACVTHKRDYTQDNSFFGAGPRFELGGSVPLAPRWSIDYTGGIAALYGRRSVVQTVNISQSAGTLFPASYIRPTCASGCPVNAGYSDNAWVPNADAMVGLSYAITSNIKATLSYRFDGYWNALKAYDSTGQLTDLNRFYQGTMLRLTMNDGGSAVRSADSLPQSPAIKNAWTWWVEGGAAHLSGDPGVAGLNNPPFDVASKSWGLEGAAGFDYSLDNTWHLSGQFRYGRNKASSNSNNPLAVFNVATSGSPPIVVPVTMRGSNTAEHKESHWLADFMVGRELGLGQGLPSMARFGVRVAEIRSKTTGSAQWNNVPMTASTALTTCATAPNPAFCETHKRDYTQNNSFFGAGPRVELDGSIPLIPRWSIDYMGGVAGLYGRRTAVQTVTISQSGGTLFPASFVRPTCATGCPVNAGYSDNAWVPNADAMVGLSYSITPNLKTTLSYRFDGYWNALKGFDSNGQVTDLNRFYQGVMVRVSMTN